MMVGWTAGQPLPQVLIDVSKPTVYLHSWNCIVTYLAIEGLLDGADVLPDALVPFCLHLHSNCARQTLPGSLEPG